MRRSDEGELQLDRSQLSYLEHLSLSIAESSPAQKSQKGPPQRFFFFFFLKIDKHIFGFLFSLGKFKNVFSK